ncbi:unnamed protein product [Durusdinium trenchii]|uniref:PUB domain-containing protein n=1 Tax=Durusdinium trenchii TaxID=1381693 RepID=A0ABP0IQG8_9DINO
MAIEKQLHRLCAAAGGQQETALSLLSRILGNLVDNPKESKFRRLNPNSEKLKNDLLRHEGALELLSAVGFKPTEDGHLEVPPGAPTAAEAALAAVKRGAGHGGYVAGAKHSSQPEAAAELAVLKALRCSPEGKEVLQLVERILDNVRRYPNNEKYRCINLAKSSGHKVVQALPLLKAAGFEEMSANGEDLLQLGRVHVDLLERVWAMVWWADRGHEMIKELPGPDSLGSRALGALLGMVVGDALGAPLGGQDPMAVTVQEVDKALEMCGGGLWGVAPGQVTGHSELLLCTAAALAEAGGGPATKLPMEDMALRYGKWGKSLPFRGDRSCLQVFARPMPAESMAERAREVNQKSMSCGAMVRCPALAVAAKTPEKAAQLANEDVQLSHANRTMAFACAAYSVALSQLINGKEDVEQWLKRSLDRIKSGISSKAAGGAVQPREGKDEDCWAPPGEELVACEQVLQWLRRAKSQEFLEVSDMAASSLLNHEVGNVEIPMQCAMSSLVVATPAARLALWAACWALPMELRAFQNAGFVLFCLAIRAMDNSVRLSTTQVHSQSFVPSCCDEPQLPGICRHLQASASIALRLL